MAKTHPSYTIDTTFTAKNIATALSVYTFTAAASAKVQFIVKLTNAAGGGDYVVYLTHGWLGASNPGIVLPKTTATAAAGELILEFVTMEVNVKDTDVVNVMVKGLAGDTAVVGAVRVIADNPSVFEATDTVSTVTTLTGHTAQTGDAYAIVSHTDYGNAKLVRATTPANTLDVNATGEAGIDWANVGGKTSTVALTGTSLNSVSGSIGGDVAGKVLGGGSGVFVADGVQVAASGGGATADDLWDEVVDGTYTARQLLRLLASALAAKSSGGGTTVVTFRDVADTKDRIVATVDANGNRTAITLTAT